MTPQRRIGYALIFSCLLAGPSLAEIINISVSGEIGGSGFSNTNSQLGYGMYQLSGSGSTGSVISSGSALQTANTTPSGFSVDLQSAVSYEGFVNTIGSSGVGNTLTLSFHLTQQSVLNLTGSLNTRCINSFFPACALPDSLEPDEGIQLSGPGSDFSQNAQTFTHVPVNFSATLDPGDYTLTSWSNPFTESQAPSEGNFEVSLKADFTAVPEPAGTILVPLLLLAAWQCTSLRRCTRSRFSRMSFLAER